MLNLKLFFKNMSVDPNISEIFVTFHQLSVRNGATGIPEILKMLASAKFL
jgi:hypothetical protein